MSTRSRRIVGEQRLHFGSNAELQSYYEAKYRDGGYEEGGCVVHGVDVSAWYHARRQESAFRALAPGAEETILDAGCGNGVLAARLAPRCKVVHAVDIAANALDPKLAAVPNLKFHAMNLESLGFPAEFFDKIGCVETLEHLLSPELALREFHRVLKRDGRLVLTYPTVNRTTVKHLKLGRRVDISEHLNEMSYAELRGALHAAQFEVERVEGIAFDFGALLALKHVNAFFASAITRLSLAVRSFPANSLFVSLALRKR